MYNPFIAQYLGWDGKNATDKAKWKSMILNYTNQYTDSRERDNSNDRGIQWL